MRTALRALTSASVHTPLTAVAARPPLLGLASTTSTLPDPICRAAACGVRAYSQRGFTPPSTAATQQDSKLHVYVQSPGVIAEPYKKNPPLTPQSLFQTNPWLPYKIVRDSFLGGLRSMYALAQLRRHLVGFDQQILFETAKELYTLVNEFQAERKHTELRTLVTEKHFSQMKREMKQHEIGGWATVKWRCEEITKVDMKQARLVQPSQDDIENAYGQLTIQFTSKQSFAAYNSKGKLVAGDPDKILNVVDYWVLERAVKQPGARWRLAARINP